MITIFSKIILKEIPSYIIYEDELVIAFLDISQVTTGHTLVVTKEEYPEITKIPVNVFTHLFSVVHKISLILIKTFNACGINILNNNGTVAGQQVFHYHVHLIPRFSKNEINIDFIDRSSQLNKNDYLDIQKKIISNL